MSNLYILHIILNYVTNPGIHHALCPEQQNSYFKCVICIVCTINTSRHIITPHLDISSYYKSSSVCLFVCLFVPLLLRGPLTDLRQTWWVYVGGPRNCPWGVLFWKGQRVNGSKVTFRSKWPDAILYDSRRHQAKTTPLQKWAKGTQESNLPRRVHFTSTNKGFVVWKEVPKSNTSYEFEQE